MYNIDDVYRIVFFENYYTYVILCFDDHLSEVRFKSLLAGKEEPSIGLDVLKRAKHQLICKKGGAHYQEILNEMNKDRHSHITLWQRWGPQGHYNSDAFLKESNSRFN